MSDLLEAALAYASRGWPIFPCRTDKTPYTKHGVLDATTDPATVRDWWTQWPGANIAVHCGAAGLLVIDYDPGADPLRVDDAVGGLPDTRLVARTPRGGTHEYYETGQEIASSQGRLADHVDVRSHHGYVLLPPSRTAHGAYEWESEGKPSLATEGMLAACRKAQEKSADRDTWIIEPDMWENVEDAIKWAKEEARPAIEGSGGDNATYAAAAMMKSYGLSEPTALEVLWEHFNPRCNPPWDYDDLAAKIEHGYAYNTSPPGNVTEAYHKAKRSQQFKPVFDPIGSDGWNAKVGRYTFLDYEAMKTLPPPSWLIPDLLPTQGYGLLIGAPGSYKTFLALDIALSVASGLHPMIHGGEWSGMWPEIERPGPVLYIAGEGHTGIRKRVEAWAEHHGVDVPDDFILGNPVPYVHEDAEVLDIICDTLREKHDRYALVVLDTVGRSLQGVNENAQEHASAFTRLVEGFQGNLGASVLALHHTGHEHDRGRGSSVFRADADMEVLVQKDRDGMVRLKMAKQKDAPEWADDRWAKLETVGDTLVPVASEAPKRTPRDQDGKSKTTLAIVDEAVFQALKDRPMQELTDSKLAEIVAYGKADPETGDPSGPGVSASSVRQTWLPKIKEYGASSKSGSLYDPDKGRWRYSPVQ